MYICCERRRLLIAAAASLMVFLLASPEFARADRIILRNLKILTDRTVASFDEDGIRLNDGSGLTWDEIERAQVAPEKQAAFDKLLTELGPHLYRIRQRLTTGDYEGLLPHAEAIYPRYVGRTSDAAYMVMQALMWGRLAAGQREAALEPYLRCLQLLRARGREPVNLPGERRLKIDPRTGLTPDLVPVWFDQEAAARVLPEVFRRIAEMPRPRPDGAYIYYATLALAAGDDAAAAKVLGALQSQEPGILELQMIVEAQREVITASGGVASAKLGASLQSLSPANRPLALYWLGLGNLKHLDPAQRRSAMLRLLRIPALHGSENPELAAAALFHVMQALAADRDAQGSVAVRRELLERYGHTYFAGRLKETSEKPMSEDTP